MERENTKIGQPPAADGKSRQASLEEDGFHFDIEVPADIVPGKRYITSTAIANSGKSRFTERYIFRLMSEGVIRGWRLGRTWVTNEVGLRDLLDYEEASATTVHPGATPGKRRQRRLRDLLPSNR